MNPGARAVPEQLEITLTQHQATIEHGHVTVGGHRVRISLGDGNKIPVDVAPGTTSIRVSVDTGGVRCASTPMSALPAISAALQPPGTQ